MKLKLIFIIAVTVVASLSVKAMAMPYGVGRYGECKYNISCTISLSTTGTVNLPLSLASGGRYSIDKDTVSVTTDSPSGYSLTVSSTSATDNNMISGANTISSTSATSGSPTVLPLNNWGYRVDSILGFGAGPSSTVTNATSSSLTFAQMPLLGSPQLIKSTASPATSDVTEFWYGIHADISQTAGTYSTQVIYTATAL